MSLQLAFFAIVLALALGGIVGAHRVDKSGALRGKREPDARWGD